MWRVAIHAMTRKAHRLSGTVCGPW
jgi:hypothetical protein